VPFRRGFKSQCERRSVEFRRELGLKNTEALSSTALANKLQVTVRSTNDVHGIDTNTLSVLNDETDDSWSAFTLRVKTSNLVVYKPVSSVARVNSVIMHELSHIILGHQLAQACVYQDGSLAPGNFDQDQEDEADWLAGTLLLPRAALLSIRRNRLTDVAACKKYQVSQSMLNWRVRMTGVDYQVGRSTKTS